MNDFLKQRYVKPLLRGYTGSKFGFLQDIVPHFPKQINTFVDMFAGGGSVSANVTQAKHVILNEFQPPVLKFHETEYSLTAGQIVKHLRDRISKHDLRFDNRPGYEAFRDNYNIEGNPIDLILLARMSFSGIISFNPDWKFSNTWASGNNKGNALPIDDEFVNDIVNYKNITSKQNREFVNGSFENFPLDTLQLGDFVYCDPPYFATRAKYNKFWGDEQLKNLAEMFQYFVNNNIGFGYSDMMIVNDQYNVIMHDFVKRNKNKVIMKRINSDYSNSLDKKKREDNGKNLEIYMTNIIK